MYKENGHLAGSQPVGEDTVGLGTVGSSPTWGVTRKKKFKNLKRKKKENKDNLT